jgi:hypothetical protein
MRPTHSLYASNHYSMYTEHCPSLEKALVYSDLLFGNNILNIVSLRNVEGTEIFPLSLPKDPPAVLIGFVPSSKLSALELLLQ